MMKKSIHSPFRKLKLLLVIPLMALVFYAFAKPEFITPSEELQTDNVSMVNLDQDAKGVTLKGKVVDPEGKPLAGAAVVIKGTTTGTITDIEGFFKLKDVPPDREVVISYVGFQTVQTRADVENSMLIKMDRTSVGIDKVVVVGYGQMQSASLPPSPISLNISKDTKNPPLYVVDGAIITGGIVNAINPESIQSINVLKDQSAVKKYGEAAKNGVVEITLKKNWFNGTYKSDTTKNLIRIRGNNGEYPPPLILLDGEVIDKKQMEAVKPDNIESISVLKDKSATAVYGEKGKDGVILITSKKKGVGAAEPQIKKMTFAPGEGTKTTDVFVVVEEMPQFPGGEKALMQFIMEQVRYPKQAMLDKVTGKVLVNFIVNSSGKIENIKIVRGVRQDLDNEAVRVIGQMPDWTPGKQGGKAVNVSYTIPIQFKLRPDKKTEEVTVVGIGAIQKKKEQTFVVVEQMPQFPGGAAALMKFIRENVKYPAQATADKAQGTVIMNFVIRSDGKVDQLNVERGVHPALDAEATRVLGLMPAWTPGMQGGKSVDVAYTVPIQFKLQ